MREHLALRERKKRMWELRCEGWTYQAIADEFGANRERVRQIVFEVERRMERACREYSWSVTDPIVYGVWHTFTHEGRRSVSVMIDISRKEHAV